MKKFLWLSIAIVISSFIPAQQNLKIKNADLGLGGFSVLLKNSNEKESGGLQFSINTDFALGKNLFSVNYMKGGGVGSGYAAIGGDFSFDKIDVLYGRAISITKWMDLEGFAGLGYYAQNSNLYLTDNPINKSAINFPVKLSLVLFPKNRIDLGLSAGYNANSLNDTFTGSLYIRYNFMKQ